MTKKNPWIAAILNLIFYGAGTMYVGKRVAFGLILTFAMLVVRYVEIEMKLTNLSPEMWPWFVGSLAVAQVACAIDGFNEVKKVNAA
ncbi:MAG: hypothetical protein WDO15_03860 [Bacteroidota bacterium]